MSSLQRGYRLQLISVQLLDVTCIVCASILFFYKQEISGDIGEAFESSAEILLAIHVMLNCVSFKIVEHLILQDRVSVGFRNRRSSARKPSVKRLEKEVVKVGKLSQTRMILESQVAMKVKEPIE
jgi:hypothetical protein